MIQALERPATTAIATKSCSLIASVSPRICRAKRGHSRSAMTRTTFLKLGSDTATSTTAIRMVGNDSPMSVRRMRTVSVRPPRYPEISPSSVPNVPATPMATIEARSEIRLPQMIRLSTSRPKRSVPSGCSRSPRSIHTGGMDFCVMSPSVGLWGARYGANTAVKTSAARTMPGNHGSESLGTGTPDPRVEIAVQHVHEEVARQVERAQHEHAGLHDRIVARGDRLEDQPSEARPGEHGLGDDGAAEELHEQHDGEGDDGQQRVLQSVLPEHHLLVQSLEARELDVVGAEHLEHCRAREAEDRGGGEIAEREGGQDQVLEATAAAGRQQTQHDTEEQDQHEPEPERRHGLPEHREHSRRPVHDPSPAHRGVHAEGDADQHAEEHGDESELDGGGQTFPDVLGDRPSGEDRLAEVATGEVLHVDRVLDGQGLVEAEIPRQDFLIALGGVDVEQEMDRIARQARQDEHDADHHEHAQDGLQHAPDEKPHHGVYVTSMLTASASRTPSCETPCGRGSAASRRPWAPPRRCYGRRRWRRRARTHTSTAPSRRA